MKKIINKMHLCATFGLVLASAPAACGPVDNPPEVSPSVVSGLTNDIKAMLRSWSALEADNAGADSVVNYKAVLAGIDNSTDPVGVGTTILEYSTGRIVLPDDQYFVEYLRVVNKVINGIPGQAEGFLSRPYDEQLQLILDLSSRQVSSASDFQKSPVGAELRKLQGEMTQYRMANIVKERLETLVVMHFVNRLGSVKQEIVDSWAMQAGILDNSRIVSQLQKNGIDISGANTISAPASPAPEDN